MNNDRVNDTPPTAGAWEVLIPAKGHPMVMVDGRPVAWRFGATREEAEANARLIANAVTLWNDLRD